MKQPDAWQQAEDKMREAEQWREAGVNARRRFRFYRLLYVARNHRFKLRLKRRGSMSPNAVYSWSKKINEALDMMMTARENIQVCAQQARAAENMARIYYEEFEGRELAHERERIYGAG